MNTMSISFAGTSKDDLERQMREYLGEAPIPLPTPVPDPIPLPTPVPKKQVEEMITEDDELLGINFDEIRKLSKTVLTTVDSGKQELTKFLGTYGVKTVAALEPQTMQYKAMKFGLEQIIKAAQ